MMPNAEWSASDHWRGALPTSKPADKALSRVAEPEKEIKEKMSHEELAQMSLESLLYYVLVGEGRRR